MVTAAQKRCNISVAAMPPYEAVFARGMHCANSIQDI